MPHVTIEMSLPLSDIESTKSIVAFLQQQIASAEYIPEKKPRKKRTVKPVDDTSIVPVKPRGRPPKKITMTEDDALEELANQEILTGHL